MAEQSNPGLKALVTGAVLGVAAAAFGGYTMYADKVTVPQTHVGAGGSADSLTAEAEAVKENLRRDRTITDVAPEGAFINGVPRITPLFFSTELWQITQDDKQRNTVIDIYDPAAANIHGNVPNTWFIANGISDALGRADGLQLDSDSDGFTNEEEFSSKTLPADASSYPDLVRTGAEPKLEVLRVDVARALITTDSMFADASRKPEEVNIRIFRNAADINPVHKVTVKPGQSFDLAPNEKEGRFTLVAFEKRPFPGFTGSMQDENVIVVRDNVTASNEKQFVIRAGKPAASGKDRGTPNEKGRQISDTTVTFRVTAGTAVGKKEGVVRAQLHGSFDIPGGKAGGAPLRATVESVDAGKSANIRIEGLESPVNIPKGASKPKPAKK